MQAKGKLFNFFLFLIFAIQVFIAMFEFGLHDNQMCTNPRLALVTYFLSLPQKVKFSFFYPTIVDLDIQCSVTCKLQSPFFKPILTFDATKIFHCIFVSYFVINNIQNGSHSSNILQVTQRQVCNQETKVRAKNLPNIHVSLSVFSLPKTHLHPQGCAVQGLKPILPRIFSLKKWLMQSYLFLTTLLHKDTSIPHIFMADFNFV